MKNQYPIHRCLSAYALILTIHAAVFMTVRAAPGNLDPTSAATITVTNTNDSGAGSLRQAIADATPGSTINFDPNVFATPQTVTLTSGTLYIDKNLTIQGPGANF